MYVYVYTCTTTCTAVHINTKVQSSSMSSSIIRTRTVCQCRDTVVHCMFLKVEYTYSTRLLYNLRRYLITSYESTFGNIHTRSPTTLYFRTSGSTTYDRLLKYESTEVRKYFRTFEDKQATYLRRIFPE